MPSDYELLYECYVSGQMSEAAWQWNLQRDEVFAQFVKNKNAALSRVTNRYLEDV